MVLVLIIRDDLQPISTFMDMMSNSGVRDNESAESWFQMYSLTGYSTWVELACC